MTDLTLLSDVTVELIDSMGDDASIVRAAQVSVKGANAPEAGKGEGLINYLMREKHGCYDDETEVLTSDGWKAFPAVDGTELFATLDLASQEIRYAPAQRVIHDRYDGEMIRVKSQQVDLLVTPDHRMVGEARTGAGWGSHLKTFPAHEMEQRAHRLNLGGGFRAGVLVPTADAELLGFLIADANVASGTSVHVKKARKIEWLNGRTQLQQRTTPDTYGLLLPPYLRRLAKLTYTETGDRTIPREVLETWSSESIGALIDGYFQGDGHLSAAGKYTMSTVSTQLADDLQEAALLAGSVIEHSRVQTDRTGAYSERPVHHLTLFRARNARPRLGWTRADRAREIARQHYSGGIHCVTVETGTLYVRRNRKSLWCGNSPFEHNAMTFYVKAPIFVFREWHRHRIASYNERSGRYSKLLPEFYVPAMDRPLVNAGTSAKPQMVAGVREQVEATREALIETYAEAWDTYQLLLDQKVANEIARLALPVAVYSEMYATMNLRSLMNFLSLRTHRPDATHVSRPQREIEMGAEQLEVEAERLFPIAMAAFNANGRVAP